MRIRRQLSLALILQLICSPFSYSLTETAKIVDPLDQPPAVSAIAEENILITGSADIERGISFPPLDLLASAMAIPIKVLLLNKNYANHNISPETEAIVADFVRKNNLHDVKVRINQFAPFQTLWRTATNGQMGIPYRIFGMPMGFIASTIGRPFGGLIISDFYDPFSNTVNIYSDDVAIALHELGHANDFAHRRWKGTYAITRKFPGMNLYQEALATNTAINYLKEYGPDEEWIKAPNTLYPAYSSYCGSYLHFVPFGWLGALLGGHAAGRYKSHQIKKEIEARTLAKNTLAPNPNDAHLKASPDPAALSDFPLPN